MIKKLLGIAPKRTEDGAFSPSRMALKLATSPKTDYDGSVYDNAYQGKQKILMVATEERNMTMKNGKKFSTGNHPVEMLVPMLHFRAAGFDVDVFTPTGDSVKLEMWAMPDEDEAVMGIYADYMDQLEKPRSLADFVKDEMADSSEYAAVFIPGGHGVMIGLPEDPNLGRLIHWSHANDLFMLSICHGPGAFIAAQIGNDQDDFLYKGYSMTVFPDAVDKQSPMIGYMPGHMPWQVCKELTDLGVTIVNKKADSTVHVDRKLITGASPQASNNLGKLAAQQMLGHMCVK